MDKQADEKLKQEILEMFIKIFSGLVFIKIASKGDLDELKHYFVRLDELMREKFTVENLRNVKNKEILKIIEEIAQTLNNEFPQLGEKIDEAYKEAAEEFLKLLIEDQNKT